MDGRLASVQRDIAGIIADGFAPAQLTCRQRRSFLEALVRDRIAAALACLDALPPDEAAVDGAAEMVEQACGLLAILDRVSGRAGT